MSGNVDLSKIKKPTTGATSTASKVTTAPKTQATNISAFGKLTTSGKTSGSVFGSGQSVSKEGASASKSGASVPKGFGSLTTGSKVSSANKEGLKTRIANQTKDVNSVFGQYSAPQNSSNNIGGRDGQMSDRDFQAKGGQRGGRNEDNYGKLNHMHNNGEMPHGGQGHYADYDGGHGGHGGGGTSIFDGGDNCGCHHKFEKRNGIFDSLGIYKSGNAGSAFYRQVEGDYKDVMSLNFNSVYSSSSCGCGTSSSLEAGILGNNNTKYVYVSSSSSKNSGYGNYGNYGYNSRSSYAKTSGSANAFTNAINNIGTLSTYLLGGGSIGLGLKNMINQSKAMDNMGKEQQIASNYLDKAVAASGGSTPPGATTKTEAVKDGYTSKVDTKQIDDMNKLPGSATEAVQSGDVTKMEQVVQDSNTAAANGQKALTQNSEGVATLQGQVAAYQTEEQQVDAEIKQLEEQEKANEEKLKTANETIEKQQKDLETNTKNLNENEKKLSENEKNLKTHTESVSKCEQTIGQCDTDIKSLGNQKTPLVNQRDQLKNVKTSDTASQETINKQIQQLEQQIKQLEDQIKAKETTKKEQNKQLTEFKKQIETDNKNIETCKNTKKELETKITKNKKQLEAARKEAATATEAKAKLAALKERKTLSKEQIAQKLATAKQGFATAQTETGKITTAITNAGAAKDSAQRGIDTQVQQLQTQAQSLADEKSSTSRESLYGQAYAASQTGTDGSAAKLNSEQLGQINQKIASLEIKDEKSLQTAIAGFQKS